MKSNIHILMIVIIMFQISNENHIKKAKDVGSIQLKTFCALNPTYELLFQFIQNLFFQGLCKFDATIFLNDEDKNSSEEENKAKLNSFFKKQETAAMSISDQRTKELKMQVTQRQRKELKT